MGSHVGCPSLQLSAREGELSSLSSQLAEARLQLAEASVHRADAEANVAAREQVSARGRRALSVHVWLRCMPPACCLATLRCEIQRLPY